MPIFFLKDVALPPKKDVKVMSFRDVVSAARPPAFPQPVPSFQESQVDNSINKDSTVRPKHIEDESLAYKASGYVKDLLREEK